MVAIDCNFWENQNFEGAGVTACAKPGKFGAINGQKLFTNENFINSGRLAIDVASRLGAETVYLLGFDGFAKGGLAHFYDTRPKDSAKVARYPRLMDKVAPFINSKVYNCTRETAINTFEKKRLEDVIDSRRGTAAFKN